MPRLLPKTVGNRPRKRNFRLFRIITHEILFLVLPKLNLLAANGYTLLNSNLMDLWNDIKHGWWLLKIVRHMVLIMRRHLHLWLK